MDKLVNIETYERLEGISKLATIVAMEFEPYILLAMKVEQYLETPTSVALGDLAEAVNICAKRYPDFQPIHQRLITKLIKHGHISMVDKTVAAPDPVNTAVEQPVDVSSIDTKPKSNVINIFSKRKVDKHD